MIIELCHKCESELTDKNTKTNSYRTDTGGWVYVKKCKNCDSVIERVELSEKDIEMRVKKWQ